eukprot:6213731-Pleurochrysis_carterae.AAC.1
MGTYEAWRDLLLSFNRPAVDQFDVSNSAKKNICAAWRGGDEFIRVILRFLYDIHFIGSTATYLHFIDILVECTLEVYEADVIRFGHASMRVNQIIRTWHDEYEVSLGDLHPDELTIVNVVERALSDSRYYKKVGMEIVHAMVSVLGARQDIWMRRFTYREMPSTPPQSYKRIKFSRQ